MIEIINLVRNKMNLIFTFLVLLNLSVNTNSYVIGNKLTNKVAGNGQSNIAYSQDNKGSYNFAYEVTDKAGATNFRQETGHPKSVKGSYGLTDVDGRTRLVNYKADKYGFVATVDTNEPGTGREDAANAAYNGPDKGAGWAYAVQVQDPGMSKQGGKNKYDGSTYQSYSYSSNFNNDEAKYNQNSNNNNNDDQYNEKNYDRREEYKKNTQLDKPIINQKQESTTETSQANKKDDLIKNVNYESGGHFDTNLPPNSETDKNYDQPKQSVSDDNSDNNNLDDKSEEEPYEKRTARQMHLISHPKTSRSDNYLTTIEKLAKKEKIKPASSKTPASNKKSNSKSDKIISKLISLSSSNSNYSFDDGAWNNEKYSKYDVK